MFQNNYLEEIFFENPLFGTGRGQSIKFDSIFFGPELMAQYGDTIKRTKWKNLSINGDFVTYNEFFFVSGFEIDRIRYNKLRGSFLHAKKTYGTGDVEPINIEQFFSRLKKG
jgi:hypothetical protein